MVTNGEPTFPHTFDGLMALVTRLRGPEGCPWDGEQTRRSMARYVLEECYELLEAIEEGDDGGVVEEVGDLMFHLAFQVQLGKEETTFDEDSMFGSVIDKLTRRHPHVFGAARVSGSQDVVDNWQALKREERAGTDASALSGVPGELPALAHAQIIQERAAGIGFDREAELGDVLFSIVNASRWMGLDAEVALRGASARFRRRFTLMEQLGRERGTPLEGLTLDQKEALWQESKRLLD
jgi:tetrapyrrole methylase family protein/MazG family protein